MKWRGRRGSGNIIDRRRSGGGRGVAIGGAGGFGLLAIVVVGYFLGVDLTPLLDDGQMQGGGGEITAADEEAAQFVSVTLADTEEIWADIFANEVGRAYEPAELVLFKGATQSACGGASAASGPFYCPPEERIFLDTDFFTTLDRRLGAGGDFAAAYVVAHEVAHHVQNELGVLSEVNAVRQRSDEATSNALSVRIELQADCFSGIWARRAEAMFGSLEPGDIEEAMNAAAQIGDDTLQREAGRTVRPDSFTHGTSEQRQRWFATGYEQGSLEACDTFATDRI
ncbi:MAG: KPN_02809 family neutral zinc metallopeptidase [Limimaricola soesokkakensis]|uniref:KPN_02809 family neutral zinc metallopeptidase n=1 Tax=Limimaricola soesokkakensis TaxID=1343159 RepID=UPI0040593FDB